MPVTQFRKLTQGFLGLAEFQETSSAGPHCYLPHPTRRASPCPGQEPFASARWVLSPTVQICPPLGQVPAKLGKGKESLGWMGGMASKDKPQASREGEGAASGTQRRGAVGLRDSGVAALGMPAGPSSLFMDGGGPDPHTSWWPPLHTHSRSPTSLRVRLNEDSEVDDAGGEVKGCLLAVVDH